MRKVSFAMVLFAVLAVINIGYGIFVRAVGSGTLFFLTWEVLGAAFAVLAYMTYIDKWSEISPKVMKGAYIVLAVVLLALTLVEICIVGSFEDRGEDNLDYVIVLGAQVYEDGPSPVLKYRLDKAVEYLERNPDTKCIVTGGQGDNEPFAEADGMEEYLTAAGIDSNRIIKETESKTTSQNIRNCVKLLGDEAATKKVGLITNNFHLFRAKGIADKAGLKNYVGIAADSTPAYLPNNMFREFFGVCKDIFKGNM